MIRLLDRTLSTLDYGNEAITGNALSELASLLSKAGADWIEIPLEAYCLMGAIPEGVKAVLRIRHSREAEDYPGFDYYISKSKEAYEAKPLINEIQVNDVKEIELLKRYQNLKHVCITGLDDLILSSYSNEMKRILSIFGKNVWFCPEDHYHCATALAVEWLARGGRNAGVSFMGRGGYAAFEEVILAARIALRQKVSVDLTLLPRIQELLSRLSSVRVAPNKAVLGSRIFTVESGVHADGLIKNPTIYEPYPPQSVGKERRIVLGKHSGRVAIKVKARERGIELDDQMAMMLLEKVRAMSIEKKRGVTEDEFGSLLMEVALNEV
jgi:homocitrate synthase NifV